jgi:hypothetical protein
LSKKHLKDLIRRRLGPDKLLATNRRSAPDGLPWENARKVLRSKQKLGGNLIVIYCKIAFEEAAQSERNRSILTEVRRNRDAGSRGINVHEYLLIVE